MFGSRWVDRSETGLGLWLSSAMTPYLMQEFQGGSKGEEDFEKRFWMQKACIQFSVGM